MNHQPNLGRSACPHDCPSTCALEVELLDDNSIGRVHGAKANTYISGVIGAKVARYAAASIIPSACCSHWCAWRQHLMAADSVECTWTQAKGGLGNITASL